eukprot:gb/GECG01016567.1/.p1 GENE.gb/GECG01016567.1/~~gb/GECG01016567.1/.p1  ORF type:complete len:171 (+),score=10.69 gb/GECG01016567.1/:1-513(+)
MTDIMFDSFTFLFPFICFSPSELVPSFVSDTFTSFCRLWNACATADVSVEDRLRCDRNRFADAPAVSPNIHNAKNSRDTTWKRIASSVLLSRLQLYENFHSSAPPRLLKPPQANADFRQVFCTPEDSLSHKVGTPSSISSLHCLGRSEQLIDIKVNSEAQRLHHLHLRTR